MMEDMISKIIELDKKARDELNQVGQRRINSEKRISDLKEQKRVEYIEKARENIKMLEREEKLKSAVKLKIIENSYAQKYNRINEIYYRNKEEWVNTIVDRVIRD